jgi:hypothetical protein
MYLLIQMEQLVLFQPTALQQPTTPPQMADLKTLQALQEV